MITPKKRFSQNFLKSKDIAKKIVSLLDMSEEDTIIEIGPGEGALTDFLYKQTKNLILIELDRDIYNILTVKYKEAILLNENASLTNICNLGTSLKIVGNLPYGEYANIIVNMINHRECISKMVFMVQKEVALRLIANSKDKSWLWAYTNTFFDIRYALSVPGRFFYPVPKVVSGVLVFDKKIVYPNIEDKAYITFLKTIYANKRKMLKQKLKTCSHYDIKRADELGLEDILYLYNIFSCSNKNLLI